MRGSPRFHTVAAVVACLGGLVAVPQAIACGSAGYTYAGFASVTRSHGVGARVTAVGAPVVNGGHVAGWVGVGGPGEGPHGSDEWIQVGFSGFQGSLTSSLYYEVTRAGAGPRYVQIERGLAPGASRRVAVLEMAKRPNWWRVWVNGRPVSAPTLLPGSHGVWRAIATAESWGGGGAPVCNDFGYRFDRIVVAQAPGGGWRSLASALPIRSGGFKVLRPSSSSFVATSGRIVRPALRPTLTLAAAKPAPAPAPAPAPSSAPADPAAPPPSDLQASTDPAPAPDPAAPPPPGGPLDS